MRKKLTLTWVLILAFAVSAFAAYLSFGTTQKSIAEMSATTDDAFIVKADYSESNAGTYGEGGTAGNTSIGAVSDEVFGLYGYKATGTAYYYGWITKFVYNYPVDTSKNVSVILEPNYESSGDGSAHSAGSKCRRVHIEMVGATSGSAAWDLYAPWAGGTPDRIRLSGSGSANATDTATGKNYVKAFYAGYNSDYYLKVEIVSNGSSSKFVLSAVNKSTLEADEVTYELTFTMPQFSGKVSFIVSYYDSYSSTAIANVPDRDKTTNLNFGIYNFNNEFAVLSDEDYSVKADYSNLAGTLGEGGKAGIASVMPIVDEGKGLYGYKAYGTAYYYGWETEFTYDYAINTSKPVSFLLEPNYESSGNASGQYNASTLCRRVHIEMAGTGAEAGAVAWNLFAPWAGGAPDRIRFSGTGVASQTDTSTGTNYVNAFYAANNSSYYLKVEIVPNGTSSKLVLSAVSKTTLIEDDTKFEYTFNMPTFTGDVSLSVSYYTNYNATAIGSVPEREQITNLNFGIYNFRNGDVKSLSATDIEGDAGDAFTLSDRVSYTLFDGQTAPSITYTPTDSSLAVLSSGTLTIGSGNTDASTTVTVAAGNVSTSFTVTRTHTWDSGVTTAATCSATGVTTYTCTGCSAENNVEIAINPAAHNYVYDSFVWDGYTAQAKYICSHNESHIDMYDADITSAITARPTPAAQGVKTYTASYGGEEDTKTQGINLTINSRNITIGTDITLKVYAGVYGTDAPTMEFDISDSTIDTVKTGDFDSESDEYVFTCKIAPQNVGKSVTLTLTGADDETLIKTTSVAEYISEIYTEYSEKGLLTDELAELLARILAYSDAATDYLGGTGTLMTDYAEVAAEISEAGDYTPVNSFARTESTEEDTYFNSAKVAFGATNKIIVYFRASDVSGLTAEINGKAVAYTNEGNGVYSVKTSDIYAYGFDEIFTFTLKRSGETVQTLEYDLASYVYAVVNGESFSEEYKALAIALYNYGKAAETYSAS